MRADIIETVVEHSVKLQPSFIFHAPVTVSSAAAQVLMYPMYYLGGMKARVNHVQCVVWPLRLFSKYRVHAYQVFLFFPMVMADYFLAKRVPSPINTPMDATVS